MGEDRKDIGRVRERTARVQTARSRMGQDHVCEDGKQE